MDRCPACGSDVPPSAGSCPRCGLQRGAAPYAPQAARPNRRQSRLLVALATGLAVLVVAALGFGGLWLSGSGPFAADSSATANRHPVQPKVTVTVTPTVPTVSTTPTTPPTPTPTPKSLSQVYAEVASGVGMVGVTTCDGAASGTGFLVS